MRETVNPKRRTWIHRIEPRFNFSAYREETGNEQGGSLLVMPGKGLFIGKSERFEGVAATETKGGIFSWRKQELDQCGMRNDG